VIRNTANGGPARSRNIAIARSVSPYVAILDGDDILLPGRFSAMFAQEDWDFCADNIVFFSDQAHIADVTARFTHCSADTMTLDFADFVSGNMPAKGRPRGELGFLKPIMRRAFLQQHNLHYIEECRLGEDFLFYAEALAAGARYTVIPQCGYAALVRENSLSGNHAAADLAALYRNEKHLLDRLTLSGEEFALMKRRIRSTRRKFSHRHVLATKAQHGLLHGVISGLARPTSFVDIAKDHWHKHMPAQAPVPLPRSLLPVSHFSGR
jgi:succinoglycan biosynthesis protein ExoU